MTTGSRLMTASSRLITELANELGLLEVVGAFVDGDFFSARDDDELIAATNPADGRSCATVVCADAVIVDPAVVSAQRAFEGDIREDQR